jgi:hypothetical protein
MNVKVIQFLLKGCMVWDTKKVFGVKSCNDRDVVLVWGVNSKTDEQNNEKWSVFKEPVFRKNLVLYGNAFI